MEDPIIADGDLHKPTLSNEPVAMRALRAAAGPLVGVALVIGFLCIYRALELPSPEQIQEWARLQYLSHPYLLVFVAAIAEGLLLLNWYLPGSLVVALAVVWAPDWQSFVVSVLLVIVAFLLTSLVNYGIGRLGLFRLLLMLGLEASLTRNRAWVTRGIPWAIWISSFHPNLGALTSTSCGILRYPFLPFLARSGAALTVWMFFWALIARLLGLTVLKGSRAVVVLIAALLILAIVKAWPAKRGGNS